MPRQQDVNAHFGGTVDDGIEIVHLEPQQHSVSVWPIVRIRYWPVMMLHFEAVELKNKLAVGNQLFVLIAAMIAAAAEETLIPRTAGFDVANSD